MAPWRNVAFKVDKQNPTGARPSKPMGTVINCRKPGGKNPQRLSGEVRSRQVPLQKVPGAGPKPKQTMRKRKAVDEEGEGNDVENPPSKKAKKDEKIESVADLVSAIPSLQSSFPLLRPQLPKPTRMRRGKPLSTTPSEHVWYGIMEAMEPAQLLEWRPKIALCYTFLKRYPGTWKASRKLHYGDSLPEPPVEINEFQYADLRHGHGCMSCRTPGTRKTYWPFLRRWCRTCFQKKTIKEQDAFSLSRGVQSEIMVLLLQKCIPAGQVDSWGNFIGPGPTENPSNKTIYLLADVQNIVAEYKQGAQDNPASWHAERKTWMEQRMKPTNARREFAKQMKDWEESDRSTTSTHHQLKKDARKRFYHQKVRQLDFTPPVLLSEMEQCPAYRRAVIIPKEPTMSSWTALKPKLESELAELRLKQALREGSSTEPSSSSFSSSTGTATPDTLVLEEPISYQSQPASDVPCHLK